MNKVVQDDRAADFTFGVEVPPSVLEHRQRRRLSRVVASGHVDPKLPRRARIDRALGPIELNRLAGGHAGPRGRVRPMAVANVGLVDGKSPVGHFDRHGEHARRRRRSHEYLRVNNHGATQSVDCAHWRPPPGFTPTRAERASLCGDPWLRVEGLAAPQ